MPDGSKKSRLNSFTELDGTSSFLLLPELDGAEYLVSLLFEAGLVMSNGMGVISLSWSEIKSWLQVTQLNLSVWERMTIKSMSEAYASELSVASKKESVAPYTHVDDTLIANREIIATKLKSVFASFSKTKTENE